MRKERQLSDCSTVTLNISVDKETYFRLERERGLITRSTFVRTIIEDYIDFVDKKNMKTGINEA